MAQKSEASIVINKPILEVWGFLADFNNMIYFWDKIKAVEMIPETGGGEVGTKYDLIVPGIIGKKKIPIEVTQKLATINLEFKDKSNSGSILTGYRFTENENGTTVVMYRESGYGALGSIVTLDFISSRGAGIEFKKILEKLKEFMEK